MLQARINSRQVAGVLTIVALLTATMGIVRALGRAERPLCAEICVDPRSLKDLAGLEPDFEFDLEREVAFITGPQILELALRHPKVADLELVRRLGTDSAVKVARRLRVTVPAAGVLRISYTGERSFEAVLLVNAIASAYIDDLLEETIRLRAERIALLERGAQDAAHRLAEKRAAIGRLEDLLAASANSTDAECSAETDAIDTWQQELAAVRIAVVQGEELHAQITAELAKLRILPNKAAVALRSPASL